MLQRQEHGRWKALVLWGLLPEWRKDPLKAEPFNARAETVMEKASFAGPGGTGAACCQRCLL